MPDDLFPAATTADITLDDQIACVEREIGMRQRAYPNWVGAGKMSQRNADRELLCMQAVLATLKQQRGGAHG